MSDKQPPSAPSVSTSHIERQRSWLPSLIWLIPIVAALIGITLLIRMVQDRGPEIILTFKTAEGLEAGKTAVKYKDVQVGLVTHIRLAHDQSHVRALVQLDKNAKAFLSEDSRFWVVRPRLDVSGVSGLGTLLSGAYIGADPGMAEETTDEFIGLEAPPPITRGTDGRQFRLTTADLGSLDIGSPVYYRRIMVGQVTTYELNNDGSGVSLQVFVNAPYDRFVGTNTRFWHASGVEAQLSASGFTVRTQSLATALLGGVAFGAPDDAAGAVADANASFTLSPDQATAFKMPDGPSQLVLMHFSQSLRGLAPGAPIDFMGIEIGEVKSISVEYDKVAGKFRMPVLARIYPDRLQGKAGANESSQDADRLRFLSQKGLRAELRSGNLLTGQLYIALNFFPKAESVKINLHDSPIELPTMPRSLDELQTQLQEIVGKLNKVPYSEIAADLRKTLNTLNKTLSSADQAMRRVDSDVVPELSAALQDARKAVNNADRALATDAPLQQDMRQVLQELTRAATSVRILTDYLADRPDSLLRGKPKDPTP